MTVFKICNMCNKKIIWGDLYTHHNLRIVHDICRKNFLEKKYNIKIK